MLNRALSITSVIFTILLLASIIIAIVTMSISSSQTCDDSSTKLGPDSKTALQKIKACAASETISMVSAVSMLICLLVLVMICVYGHGVNLK